MADPRHLLGLAAEGAVARWLTACGWDVLAARQRSRAGGEVDIVAIDPAGIMVAVEVRARRTRRAGSALGSIDQRRVARLARTLAATAAASGAVHRGIRIDLVTVEPMRDRPGHWRLRREPGIR
jgi:putative endonuclease